MALNKKQYFLLVFAFLAIILLFILIMTETVELNLVLFFIFILGSVWVFLWRRSWRKRVLIFSIVILGSVMGKTLSPIKIIENTFIQFNLESFLIFMVLLFLSLAFGRLYCNYLCPFGAVQEILFIKKLKLKIPGKILKRLSYVKYFVLVYIMTSLLFDKSIISMSNIWVEFGVNESIVKYVLMGMAILIIISIYRPFCRFFCPLGALLGLISRFNLYRLIPQDCNQYGYCRDDCKIKSH